MDYRQQTTYTPPGSPPRPVRPVQSASATSFPPSSRGLEPRPVPAMARAQAGSSQPAHAAHGGANSNNNNNPTVNFLASLPQQLPAGWSLHFSPPSNVGPPPGQFPPNPAAHPHRVESAQPRTLIPTPPTPQSQPQWLIPQTSAVPPPPLAQTPAAPLQPAPTPRTLAPGTQILVPQLHVNHDEGDSSGEEVDVPVPPRDNAMASPFPQNLPPGEYHDACERLKPFARAAGFGFSIQRTKATRKEPQNARKVFLHCCKSRTYVSTSKGQRRSSSRMTNCPWRCQLVRHDGGWRVEITVPEHNHEPDAPDKVPNMGKQKAKARSSVYASPLNVTQGTNIPEAPRRIKVSPSVRMFSNVRNQFTHGDTAFVIYNDAFSSMLGGDASLTLAVEADYPFAHEACVYLPLHDCVFMTSNQFMPPNEEEKTIVINKVSRSADGGWTREEITTAIINANGGVNYRDGVLFCSQGSKEKDGGLVYMEAEAPYRSKTILNNYFGRSFNSLNDVVVHSDGSIWFTDPAYGYDQGFKPKPELPNQVYQFDPRKSDVRVVADGFGRPNGLCFSPDETTLYITDTAYQHGDGSVNATKPSTIYAFDVMNRSGSKFLTNRRVFAMADSGVPDGIKCDTAGNVYAGCGDGLSVWSPGGVILGKIIIPGGVVNFCFGKSGEIFLLNEFRFWVLKISQRVRGALLEGVPLL